MATLTTIPTQAGVEYIRILLTMGVGTPTGDAINLRGSQSYVTQTGDADFGNSVGLTLDGIDPHSPQTAGQGDIRLRHTGSTNASFNIWRGDQARAPKLLYASSADDDRVRQAVQGGVGGGFWNWQITGLPNVFPGRRRRHHQSGHLRATGPCARRYRCQIHHRRTVILSGSW